MRTIILLLDWDSTLFWRDAEGGGPIDESALPVSDDVRRRLRDYQKYYSKLYGLGASRPIRDREIPAMEKKFLDDTGFEIWQQLRSELNGVYRVLFYSQEFGDSFESPEELLAAREEAYV